MFISVWPTRCNGTKEVDFWRGQSIGFRRYEPKLMTLNQNKCLCQGWSQYWCSFVISSCAYHLLMSHDGDCNWHTCIWFIAVSFFFLSLASVRLRICQFRYVLHVPLGCSMGRLVSKRRTLFWRSIETENVREVPLPQVTSSHVPWKAFPSQIDLNKDSLLVLEDPSPA